MCLHVPTAGVLICRHVGACVPYRRVPKPQYLERVQRCAACTLAGWSCNTPVCFDIAMTHCLHAWAHLAWVIKLGGVHVCTNSPQVHFRSALAGMPHPCTMLYLVLVGLPL